VFILDLAAKLDQTADFEVGAKWGAVDFPAPFGRELTPEEKYIQELDSKSGSSLKLTILNAEVYRLLFLSPPPKKSSWQLFLWPLLWRSVSKACLQE
jgi:hypothetical protein